MRKIRIAAKIYLAFGSIFLLAVVASSVGWKGFEEVTRSQSSVLDQAIPGLRQAHRLSALNASIGALAQQLLRVRDEIVKAIRDFFYDRDYVLIDSPILNSAACEGTSTLFETPYFDETAYLSQSGQLYLEPACLAFGKVYCFGPTFRAEKSKTRRHLTEFWMVEPELAWCTLDDVMELAEGLIGYCVGRVLERRRQQLALLQLSLAGNP